jgi:hypothetical protein
VFLSLNARIASQNSLLELDSSFFFVITAFY